MDQENNIKIAQLYRKDNVGIGSYLEMDETQFLWRLLDVYETLANRLHTTIIIPFTETLPLISEYLDKCQKY